MRRKHINHRQVAVRLREHAGDELPVGEYWNVNSAQVTTHAIETGLFPAYQPAGKYEARRERSDNGWTVYARYIGEPETLEPPVIHWTEEVSHLDDGSGDMVVHCATADGQAVELHLGDEHREALGLILVDPNPDEEMEAA